MSTHNINATLSFSPPNALPENNFQFSQDLPELIQQLLLKRGLTTQEDADIFLHKSLKHLHDPFRMLQMKKAASRIQTAHQQQEVIYIYGDYDVDGITATALLSHFFKALGLKVFPYIPDRFSEGYGLSEYGITHLCHMGAKLIISVDNGVNAHAAARAAKALNIDLIVTDHHQIESVPVDAYAILNPHLPECNYPFKHLTGVGVAFKFAHACLKTINPSHIDSKALLKSLLDFVALGTIADVAPLLDENRVLVSAGLKQLKNSVFPGIRTLISPLLLENIEITATHMAFKIIPKINASGRMEHARFAVNLLMSESQTECLSLYHKLNALNESRKLQQLEDLEIAFSLVTEQHQDKNPVLVVFHEAFHQGVAGIIAARLADHYQKPAVVIAKSEEAIWKGSARSIPGISILECLDACKHLFISYGGHKDAAGLTLSEENLMPLLEGLIQFMNQGNPFHHLSKTKHADLEIYFSNIGNDYLPFIHVLEPYGQGNPEPVFYTKQVIVIEEPRWLKEKHLKLTLNQEDFYYSAIGFNFEKFDNLKTLKKGDSIDIFYKVRFDFFNGLKKIQLFLEEIQF